MTARSSNGRRPGPALLLGDDPRLAVERGAPLRIELQSGGETLLAGRWDLALERDGQPLPAPKAWSEVCRVREPGADYLELEAELAPGVRVERHLLVARDDRFALLADAALASQPAQWRYAATLTLAAGQRFEPAAASREGTLGGRSPRARLLPLALPEWRDDPGAGALHAVAGGVQWTHEARGRALFAPLFVDLHRGRLSRPFTWRRLTVAQDLLPCPDDVAVGYRVQAGARQWLVYRALSSKGNRTLLGHNLVSGMLVARFAKGKVESLVEIE